MAKRSTEFVPRQYMLDRDFEIYYYSDLHFHSVGLHSHDYFEFYFFESGAVAMELGARSYEMRQGDLLVVPPGVPHRAQITDDGQPYRRFVFWIGKAFLEDLIRQSEAYGWLPRLAEQAAVYLHHFDLLTFNALRIRLFFLLDELHTDRFGRAEMLRLELRSLLLLVNRLVREQEVPQGQTEEQNKYALISAYLDEHWNEDFSMEKLAREFYLSKSYVSHLFKKNTGVSIYQYLMKKRLSAVCAEIKSGVPIGEACLACGFRDYSGFYRVFQKEYGLSPSAYRALHRGGESRTLRADLQQTEKQASEAE